MRRIFAPLLFLAVVLLTLAPVLPAAGQAGSGVVIRLVRQSVWNGPDRPLFVQIRVTNGGQSPLTELNVVLSVQAPARARSVFQLSLQQDATPDLKSDPFPQAGAIAPGASRDFALLEPVPFLNENGLYPLRIQVLSQNVAVATLRTPMVFLAEHSESPFHLVWTWVLFERLQYGRAGGCTPGPLEADVAPGGRLDTLVTAMDSATPAAIDVVVSPVLTDQLVRMSDGYRIRGADGAVRTVPKGTGGAADAARLLEALRKIAGRPRTELVAQPFGDSRIPSLFRAGLGADLVRLVDRGRKVVGTTLGAEPSTQVFRPPLSQIDAGSAGLLGGMGAGILVLDDRSVRVAPALFPNPPPVVEIAGAGHSATA